MNPNTSTIQADRLIDLQRAQRKQPRGHLFRSWERVTQATHHIFDHVRLSPTKRIIEVGCDAGFGTVIFRQTFPDAHITGVELVPERLALARPYMDDAICGRFEDVDIEPESVDVVFAGEVIEHVSAADAEVFVNAARRVLRPNGVFVLTTPNPNYIRLWLTGRKVTDEPSHLSQWTPTDLKRLVRRHGFSVVRCEGTGRMTRRIGTMWPVSPCYGSYMLVAAKRL